MMVHVPRIQRVAAGLVLLGLVLGACAPAPPTLSGTTAVVPLFSDFYGRVNGSAVLGPAISPLTQFDGLPAQYTEAGLMVFDDRLNGQARFRLAPLGASLHPQETPAATAQDTQIDGFLSHDKIRLLYYALGEEVVGAPRTNLEVNLALNRMEQHFENLGIGFWLDDPDAPPFVLAYGVASCNAECRYNPVEDVRVTPTGIQPPVFQDVIDVLGADLLGERVAGPYALPDGSEEIVYQNGVLVSRPGAERAEVRSIVILLGIESSPLVPNLNIPAVYFVPLDESGRLGHNIPAFLWAYIEAHGGLTMFGNPITEISHDALRNIYSQCFEKFCLDFDPAAAPHLQVQPRALGQEYKNRFGSQAAPVAVSDLTLMMSVGKDITDAGTVLTITANVLRDTQPQAGHPLTLYITLPDGTLQEHRFGPTDASGVARLTLPPLTYANGIWMYFTACLELPEGRVCEKDEHLFYGN